MKKRRKVGVWLLIFMLVLTQISLPGARVQANGNDVSSVAMTEGETDSKEKAEEGTTAAKSKSTEAESNKTPEKTDASDEEKSSESSEKTEKTTSAEEETDKKDAAEEENKENNDKTESGESVKKTESDSEKQTEEEKDKTDSETEKASDQSSEETEKKTETVDTNKADSAKTNSVPTASVKEDSEQIYQVKIQPVDKDGDDISGANITLESSTNPGIASSWSSVDPVDGQYQLTEKDGENVCYYRFSITATDYEQFASESFSFTQESNPYFDLKNVENGMITIRPAMTKVSKQYQVKIQPIDESNNLISKPSITLESSTDQTNWTQKSKDSSGIYHLSEKEDGNDCYYRFSITATDYYKFTSDTFTFTEANSYFDINSIGDETITIQPVMEKKPTQYRVTIKAID